MSGYYFFLSYARLDRSTEKPGAIEQFYRDLAEEIRAQTGEAPETIGYGTEAEDVVGFLDTEDIKPGDQWPGAVESALQTCRSFVPVLSPTYLKRPRCGKEWAVFLNRLRAIGTPGAKPPPLIQPVLLVPPDRIKAQPQLVGDIQRDSEAYPELYGTQGLRVLMKAGEPREYAAFVTAFAARLIKVVEANELPPGQAVPPLDSIGSAFDESDPQVERRGLERAAFMFVAGTRTELETVRESVSRYGGSGGLSWQPYLPDANDLVVQIAREVASKENFEEEFLPADGLAFDRIDQAARDQKIVAVLTDTWSLLLAPYQKQMNQLDGRRYLNCAVIVLWNERDDETASERTRLEKALAAAFPTNCANKDPDRFFEVSSAEDLRTRLSVVLTKLKLQSVNDAEAPQKAEGPPMVLPGITGHSGVAG